MEEISILNSFFTDKTPSNIPKKDNQADQKAFWVSQVWHPVSWLEGDLGGAAEGDTEQKNWKNWRKEENCRKKGWDWKREGAAKESNCPTILKPWIIKHVSEWILYLKFQQQQWSNIPVIHQCSADIPPHLALCSEHEGKMTHIYRVKKPLSLCSNNQWHWAMRIFLVR